MDWLGELSNRFNWTVDDFAQVVRLACAGLAEADADDISQDVAASLGRAFQSGIPAGLTSKDDVDRYVYTAIRNRVGQFRLRQAKERARLAYLNPSDLAGRTIKPVYDDGPQVADSILLDLTDEQRARILNLLPEGERRLRDFMRLHLEGLTGQEIAGRLSVSSATVSRDLAKCRKYISDDALATVLDTRPGETRS